MRGADVPVMRAHKHARTHAGRVYNVTYNLFQSHAESRRKHLLRPAGIVRKRLSGTRTVWCGQHRPSGRRVHARVSGQAHRVYDECVRGSGARVWRPCARLKGSRAQRSTNKADRTMISRNMHARARQLRRFDVGSVPAPARTASIVGKLENKALDHYLTCARARARASETRTHITHKRADRGGRATRRTVHVLCVRSIQTMRSE